MMGCFSPGELGTRPRSPAGPVELQRLFEPLPATFTVVEPAKFTVPRHDYWILPMSLPHRLGVTLETLAKRAWPWAVHEAVRWIGVVWRGQPGNRNDPFRSLPDAAVAPLLALPGAISLDPADTGAADFQATADIIAGLDLVIAADTAVAHLAGAMGKPVWVMVASHA